VLNKLQFQTSDERSPSQSQTNPHSPLILQNPKGGFLPLATPLSSATLTPLAIESILRLLLRGFKQQVSCAQALRMVEEDVGFVFGHFAEDDDEGWVALEMELLVRSSERSEGRGYLGAYSVVFPRDIIVAERFCGDVVDVDFGVDWYLVVQRDAC
jgi:hypothetical protein